MHCRQLMFVLFAALPFSSGAEVSAQTLSRKTLLDFVNTRYQAYFRQPFSSPA